MGALSGRTAIAFKCLLQSPSLGVGTALVRIIVLVVEDVFGQPLMEDAIDVGCLGSSVKFDA
jgi:hypothetical protein